MKNNNNRERSRKRRNEPQSRLLNFDTSKLLSDASSIVENAASILEEEISAGIVAASKLEDQFMDAEKIRSSDHEDLINRFRGDAHEIVDMLMDLVSQSAVTLRKLNRKVGQVDPASSSQATAARPSNGMVMLQPDKELKPGETTTLPFMLENDSEKEEMEVTFTYHDLIGAGNKTISSHNVKMKPKTLTIPPSSKDKMEIEIYIPQTTEPGTYNMTIRDENMDELKANIEVVVVEA